MTNFVEKVVRELETSGGGRCAPQYKLNVKSHFFEKKSFAIGILK